MEILERSGARAVHVRLDLDLSLEATMSGLGALVLSVDGVSDSGDLTRSLLLAALDVNMAVLCISGGFQLLNSALGGGPARPIDEHALAGGSSEGGPAYHRIYIAPGSKLAAVVGSGGFVRVNSRHDTGIREADKSSSLLASAYSLEDGVIEALESPEHRWVIGVQFQPELRGELPPHFDRLFQSLADRAREFGGRVQ
ncbi:MAG: gamma-glutamyl-gamma-aminobutyrate hydrolase family protein [Chloroflexi bacterium]|nr:gamma-glutamyl-gamma-aminobutyrate hydrolase family protein [Chloroflexota bacterium]